MNKFKVGQIVELLGDHPWAGHKGEVVGLEPIKIFNIIRPRVYLFDSGIECYIMESENARIIEDGNCRYDETSKDEN